MVNTRLKQDPRGEFICDLSAIRPSDRERYQALRIRLRTAHISSKTIRHGFAMRLNEELMPVEDVSEWIRMERLCCPWLSLSVKRARSRALEVRITAPSRATEVLQMELGEPLSINILHMRSQMKRIRFGELPWTARIILGLATFNLWWSFEEFVIDRFGIWRYLPDYKFGRLCVWDLTVALGIAAVIWWLSFDRRTQV